MMPVWTVLQWCLQYWSHSHVTVVYIKEFTNKNWSLSSVKKLLTNSGTVDRKPGSGKSVGCRLLNMLDSAEELV